LPTRNAAARAIRSTGMAAWFDRSAYLEEAADVKNIKCNLWNKE
jgi:hypothetical protein